MLTPERGDHDLLLRIEGELRSLTIQVDALDRLIHERFEARDKALEVVEERARHVEVQQNEWRGTIGDLAATKLDKAVFEAFSTGISEKFDVLSEQLAVMSGSRQAQNRNVGFAIGAAGVAAAVVTVLVNVV